MAEVINDLLEDLDDLRRRLREAEQHSDRLRRDGAVLATAASDTYDQLLRVQTEYRLDGATRELRLGLWIARALRRIDSGLAGIAGRKRLFLRPPKPRFVASPPPAWPKAGTRAPTSCAEKREWMLEPDATTLGEWRELLHNASEPP